MSRLNVAKEWQQRYYEVLIYIQNNLDENLSLERLSEIAGLSSFHFHRQFKSDCGESLHDHIKRLRLEKAAFIISNTESSITDVCYLSGYESPSSFSKAFKNHFGKAPRAYRNNELTSNDVSDEYAVVPSIVRLNDRHVYFHREIGPYQEAAERAWSSLFPQAYQLGIISNQCQAIGITYDSPYVTQSRHIRYDACVVLSEKYDFISASQIQMISGGVFAVFRHIGAYKNIDKLYDYIYGQWLPQSGKALRDQAAFCHYHQMHPKEVPDEQLVTDAYIPLA